MANINLIRVDFRLIHGQVVTQWIRISGANRIIIVNDALSKDEFMGSVYKMSAPSNIDVDIFSIEKAAIEWEKNQFGEGKILILFKNVEDAAALQKKGFKMDCLQIGGLGGGNDRIATPCGVTFNQKDIEILEKMIEEGTEVYIHVVPSQPKITLEKAIEKINF